jgi:hypothetical membrane protein
LQPEPRPPDIPKRSRTLFKAATVGALLYLLLDVVAQLLPPHYSPLSQAESDLAVGPYGYVMTINFLNRGVLSLCFLLALDSYSRPLKPGPLYKAGAALFGLWSVGALLLAIFPTDVPPAPISWHGAIHLLVAVLAFIGGGLGAPSISLALRGYFPGPPRQADLLVAVSMLVAALCVVELVLVPAAPRISASYGGLAERLFLGSVLGWVVIASLLFLRSRPRPAA